jgi:16S rRNA (guanine527-N7)-methyltransferase
VKRESLDLLRQSSRKMGVELGEKELDQFEGFAAILKKWSRKISLTSIKDEREIVIRHFLDSLLLYKYIQESWFVMDIGSGNGCPGIPIKIVRPSIRMLLVESRGRKVSFLRTVIRELGLKDCQAIQQRAEEAMFQRGLRGQLDAVIARAVAKTPRLVKTATPYLKPKGRLILMKGSGVDEELETAKPVIEKMGARLQSIRQLKIPETDWTRKIVMISRQ